MIHLNSGSIIQLAYQREIMFYFGYQPANQEKNTFQTGFFHPMRCKPISRERFCEASCIYPRLQELEMKLHYSSVCISLVLPTCCLKSSRVITKAAN